MSDVGVTSFTSVIVPRTDQHFFTSQLKATRLFIFSTSPSFHTAHEDIAQPETFLHRSWRLLLRKTSSKLSRLPRA